MEPDNNRQKAFAQNKASIERKSVLDQAFPSAYASTKQYVQQTRQQLKGLNKEIKSLRSGAEQPQSPQLDMSGTGIQNKQTEDKIRQLKHSRNTLRADAYNQVQQQTKHAAPNERQRMNDAAFQELHKGAFKRSPGAVELGRNGKGMDQMQASFFRRIGSARTEKRAESTRQQPSSLQQPEKEAQNSPRVNLNLRFSGLAAKETPSQEKGKEKDLGPSRSITPSFDKAQSKANSPSKQSSEPGKGPSKDKGEGKDRE